MPDLPPSPSYVTPVSPNILYDPFTVNLDGAGTASSKFWQVQVICSGNKHTIQEMFEGACNHAKYTAFEFVFDDFFWGDDPENFDQYRKVGDAYFVNRNWEKVSRNFEYDHTNDYQTISANENSELLINQPAILFEVFDGYFEANRPTDYVVINSNLLGSKSDNVDDDLHLVDPGIYSTDPVLGLSSSGQLTNRTSYYYEQSVEKVASNYGIYLMPTSDGGIRLSDPPASKNANGTSFHNGRNFIIF